MSRAPQVIVASGMQSGDAARRQVRSASQWGALAGVWISATSVLIMALTAFQALFLTVGWGPRLALLGEGLIWSALVAAAGAFLVVVSQALRCLSDITYGFGAPGNGSG